MDAIACISETRNHSKNTVQPTQSLQMISVCIWLLTLGSYFLTPCAVLLVMLWDLDPVTFLVVQFLKSHPTVEAMLTDFVSGYDSGYLATRFCIIYIMNLIGAYEILRLSLIVLSACVFGFSKVIWLQRTAALFHPQPSYLRLQLLWVNWINRFTILFKLFESYLNQTILICLCFDGSAIISLAYVLIRLHDTLEWFLILFCFIIMLSIAMVTNVSLEILADIHERMEVILEKFTGLEALQSLPSPGERKVYARVLKGIRLIGMPFGVGSTTFFVAKKSTKLECIKMLAEQMVNVLLIE